MPKKDPAVRPNPPSERPGSKTITMGLPLEQANQLRQLATRTGLTQAARPAQPVQGGRRRHHRGAAPLLPGLEGGDRGRPLLAAEEGRER